MKSHKLAWGSSSKVHSNSHRASTLFLLTSAMSSDAEKNFTVARTRETLGNNLFHRQRERNGVLTRKLLRWKNGKKHSRPPSEARLPHAEEEPAYWKKLNAIWERTFVSVTLSFRQNRLKADVCLTTSLKNGDFAWAKRIENERKPFCGASRWREWGRQGNKQNTTQLYFTISNRDTRTTEKKTENEWTLPL